MLVKNHQALGSRPRKATEKDTELDGAVVYDWVDNDVFSLAYGRCYPTPVQVVAAESLCRLLNLNIGHDGRWQCVWRDPKKSQWDKSAAMFRVAMPSVLQCRFLDKDGDIWCCVNIEDEVHDMFEHGISNYVEQCEEAYQFTVTMIFKEVGVRPGKDTKNVAMGEKLTPTKFLPPQT